MKLNEIIRNARKKTGITQRQLADEVGVTKNSITRIETGWIYPKMKTFLKICEVLKLELKQNL